MRAVLLASIGCGALPSPGKPGGLFAFLDCEGSVEWSHFREQVGPSYRQAGFPANASLAELADQMLTEHFHLVSVANFVSLLSEPSRRDVVSSSDCVYGVVTALFVRGREFLALGELDACQADWDLALRHLGRELSLDFLESTSWGLRSADLLLAWEGASVRPAEFQEIAPPATSRLEVRSLGEGPRAVDPLNVIWPPGAPLRVGRYLMDTALSHLKERSIEVAVYGYHPVLIEPMSVLLLGPQRLGSRNELRVRLRWYGVSERDCEFFRTLCNEETRREALSPVVSRLRFKAYNSEEEFDEVAAAYGAS
eukprot:TRINITY_DN26540_c0_g1_i1.p1 TRINITY_DN26540_c0_g1~~TRINITY_DN26540_c0_g1_i1.p1  ORF type:complete len:310 (-),score=51.14 TRINITY_DN26540_c0_g1_i1:56-985(-)